MIEKRRKFAETAELVLDLGLPSLVWEISIMTVLKVSQDHENMTYMEKPQWII